MSTNEKPRARRGLAQRQPGQEWRANCTSMARLYGMREPRLPANWRTRLPDPARYYASRVEGLKRANAAGWATCRCPFHEDRHASAAANLETGGFRCFSCGWHGDLVKFHRARTGLEFVAAVRELVGVSR